MSRERSIGWLSCLVLIFTVVNILAGVKLEKEGRDWLGNQKEEARVNVSGLWQSDDWGFVKLQQAEGSREVTGTGDGWRIDGVVSGKRVYLLFSDGGDVNYSAVLSSETENRLLGENCTCLMTESSKKTRPMLLTK